jgi:hypothetical protein
MFLLFFGLTVSLGTTWLTFKSLPQRKSICLGFALLSLAGFMNGAVLLANGGHMPCSVPKGFIDQTDTRHVELTSKSHLAFLADVHGQGLIRYSLGDVVLGLGSLLVLGGCARLLLRKDL